MYSCCGKLGIVAQVAVSAYSVASLHTKGYLRSGCYLPADPFSPPPAEAARELFSPFLMHPLYLRTGGTAPAQLPALSVGWAELQFGIQFGIAARFILPAEVFA